MTVNAEEGVVEVVAKAIFDSLKGDVHTTEWDFMRGPVNVSDDVKDRYRKMARAALSATALRTAAAFDNAIAHLRSQKTQTVTREQIAEAVFPVWAQAYEAHTLTLADVRLAGETMFDDIADAIIALRPTREHAAKTFMDCDNKPRCAECGLAEGFGHMASCLWSRTYEVLKANQGSLHRSTDEVLALLPVPTKAQIVEALKAFHCDFYGLETDIADAILALIDSATPLSQALTPGASDTDIEGVKDIRPNTNEDFT